MSLLIRITTSTKSSISRIHMIISTAACIGDQERAPVCPPCLRWNIVAFIPIDMKQGKSGAHIIA